MHNIKDINQIVVKMCLYLKYNVKWVIQNIKF
jgi:hypothetical protein